MAIHFTFNSDETALVCTIEDNGIGREQSAQIQSQNKHQSFSTASVAHRLELLSAKEGNEKLLEYIDLKDENGNALGTRAILQIYL